MATIPFSSWTVNGPTNQAGPIFQKAMAQTLSTELSLVSIVFSQGSGTGTVATWTVTLLNSDYATIAAFIATPAFLTQLKKIMNNLRVNVPVSQTTLRQSNAKPSIRLLTDAFGGLDAAAATTSLVPLNASPTYAPTPEPTVFVPIAAIPVSGSVSSPSSSSSCFAGSEVVTMESGDLKPISMVQIGDRILAANADGKTSFSDVVYIPHGTNMKRTSFAMLTTASGRDIKMTKNHILPAGDCGDELPLVHASRVTVGQCVMTVEGEERVISVKTIIDQGIYTVVTNEEFIVVNGIVATPFGGINPTVANIYYNLHRLAFTVISPQLLKSEKWLQAVMENAWIILSSF
jgi:hypothetical protein